MKKSAARKKGSSRPRINSVKNASIRKIKKPGFFEIFRNSLSFIDVSEYSSDSSLQYYNLNSQLGLDQEIECSKRGKEQKHKKKLKLSFMKQNEAKLSKIASVKSSAKSVKLGNLSLKNSEKVDVVLEGQANVKNLTSSVKKQSAKLPFTPPRKSEDLFNNPKRIKSYGNSDYLNDNISGISSISHVRKINFNETEINSVKSN